MNKLKTFHSQPVNSLEMTIHFEGQINMSDPSKEGVLLSDFSPHYRGNVLEHGRRPALQQENCTHPSLSRVGINAAAAVTSVADVCPHTPVRYTTLTNTTLQCIQVQKQLYSFRYYLKDMLNICYDFHYIPVKI